MKQLYLALITNGISYECIADEEMELKDGDLVVIRCEKYTDAATIAGKIGEPIADADEFERQRQLNNKGRHIEGTKTPVVIRMANAEDLAQIENNKLKAVDAHRQTRERIVAHGLEMKLIHTHYTLDKRLILFQFSADGRIDFRELLRDLSTLFGNRVELRQIGVRDEASLLGGIGICGRPFCCSKFMHNFNSINVKMAKQQGVSLNPQNISGCCGRLKCCLYYEAYAYKDVVITNSKNKIPVNSDEESELAALDAKENADSSNDTERTRQPQRNRQNHDNNNQQDNHRNNQHKDNLQQRKDGQHQKNHSPANQQNRPQNIQRQMPNNKKNVPSKEQ